MCVCMTQDALNRVERRKNAMVVFAFTSKPSIMRCAPFNLFISVMLYYDIVDWIPPITWKARTKTPKTHNQEHGDWMNAWELNQAHPRYTKWSHQPTKPRPLSIGWMLWRWVKLFPKAPNNLIIVDVFFKSIHIVSHVEALGRPFKHPHLINKLSQIPTHSIVDQCCWGIWDLSLYVSLIYTHLHM